MIGFLLGNWKLIGIALLVAGVAAWVFTLKVELGMCREHLESAKHENAALRQKIVIQNAAIDRLKADSDRKMADASKALQDALQRGQPQVRESARLKAAASRPATPEQPRPADCPASGADRAVATIREGLK